jgi:2-oxoisovalerate ferredoxin oxidoreductase beta subunit
MAELLATLEAPVYIERVALSDNKNLMRARKAVRKALELQRNGVGFSFVEILSPCPTIWNMTPQDARKWIEAKMLPVFPLGVLRDRKLESTENAVRQTTVTNLLGLETRLEEVAQPPATKEAHRDLTVKIAGFGGQGVLLLGQILAEMGMREGREVSWLPSYGPEMRSGSAHCHVCLSHERVGSPVIEHPDALIAMNEPSLHKFAKQVAPHGMIIYNGDRLPEHSGALHERVFCVPGSEIADRLGTTKVTNMVMLGALLELTHTMTKETAFAVLKMKLKNVKLLEVDYRAIDAGIECIRKQIAERLAMHAREDQLTHAS